MHQRRSRFEEPHIARVLAIEESASYPGRGGSRPPVRILIGLSVPYVVPSDTVAWIGCRTEWSWEIVFGAGATADSFIERVNDKINRASRSGIGEKHAAHTGRTSEMMRARPSGARDQLQVAAAAARDVAIFFALSRNQWVGRIDRQNIAQKCPARGELMIARPETPIHRNLARRAPITS